MELELLRLFNGVLIDAEGKDYSANTVLERTIKNGYVLSPEIYPTEKLLKTIEKLIGISGEKANASFHKSWSVVRDAPIEQLLIQQIVHYITTYGFESLGIYSEDTIYVPHEKLELPEITADIPLVIIKGMTKEEVLTSIVELAGSGIALSKQTLSDLMVVIKKINYDSFIVKGIKNRELRSLLFDYYKIAPENPEEYLRYLIVKLTGQSLVIKNDFLIGMIKSADGDVLDSLLKVAPKDLASIFLRYKPLFLAMKSISNNKAFFNRLRKDAVEMHRPLPVDYMNNVTTLIKSGHLREKELIRKLEDASIFRKIRLAYALQYRLSPTASIVYRVRNGRGWAADFNWEDRFVTQDAMETVLESIAEDIRPKVENAVFYIPEYISYSVPATEKQFVGNFPVNTSVSVPEDMLIGIHWTDKSERSTRGEWYNYSNNRIDLDLSLINVGGKFGWDALYRSSNRDIMFSGDMTAAPLPDGASEVFYIKSNLKKNDALAMFVNYFNHSEDNPVPCKIFVAKSSKGIYPNKNYMVDINDIKASTNVTITEKANTFGLVTNIDGKNTFFFSNVSIGNAISAGNTEYTNKIREDLVARTVNPISLALVLQLAGAGIVSERPAEMAYIDLSPEALDKTTIIKLLTK